MLDSSGMLYRVYRKFVKVDAVNGLRQISVDCAYCVQINQ